jgi:hypothetical protein
VTLFSAETNFQVASSGAHSRDSGGATPLWSVLERLEFVVASTRTLSDDDHGKTLVLVYPGAVTITIPAGLSKGQRTDLLQWHASAATTPSAAVGVNLTSVGATATAGKGSLVRLLAVQPDDWAMFDLASVPAIRTVIGTSDTIRAGDFAGAVRYTSGSSVTVTVPAGLGAGFSTLVLQRGAGQVTVQGDGTTTITNRQSQLGTAGDGAVCSLFADAADAFLFAGDTG